jgi:uracil-DNA glycosylase
MNLVLVGEAWGDSEEKLKKPFVGAAGQELTRMLRDAGISREDCFITNVFNQRPPKNNVEHFFGSKKEGVPGLPPLRKGKYLLPEFLFELARLEAEIKEQKPNLILALGATASWALTGNGKITSIRGFCTYGVLCPYKILPTIHPAAVLRQWEYRPIVVSDFIKAKLEAEFPQIKRPARDIWIDPSLDDILRFFKDLLVPAERISFDIETKNQTITCISFSPNPGVALTIPFHDERKEDWNYWPTLEEEIKAWSLVRAALDLPQPKLGQNGVYDMQYLWYKMGIPVRNYSDDTMLLHHTLQPELPKGLGFLGSIYTNEAAWKTLRDEVGEDEAKPND